MHIRAGRPAFERSGVGGPLEYITGYLIPDPFTHILYI